MLVEFFSFASFQLSQQAMFTQVEKLITFVSNLDPIYHWISLLVIASLLAWGIVSLLLRMRTSRTKGKKLTFRQKISRRKVDILLEGDKNRNPDYVTITLRNPGTRPVDLQAPVLIFKRWKSERRFRINTFGRIDDFPMWLEPGYEADYKIKLAQFYDRVPILKRATRISAELKEVNGKKFKSPTIRLKRI